MKKPRTAAAALALCALVFCGGSGASAARHAGGLNDDEVISSDVLRAKMLRGEKLVVFDARTKRSYGEGRVAGALLPLSDEYYRKEALFAQGIVKKLPDRSRALAEGTRKYPKNTPIVTYCNTGCQSGAVLLYDLKRLGFTDVRDLEDGFQVWESKGYPVERNS